MKQDSIVFRNAAFAVLQVVVSAGSAFVLFYFLLRTIGPAKLGIWSVVLATVSAARFTELGLSGGVVKYVAQYLARNDENSVGEVIQTAVLSIGGFIVVVIMLVYPFLGWLLSRFIPLSGFSDAVLILPFALIALWMTIIGNVFLSALDGCKRTDIRSVIMLGGTGIYLVLVFIFVPDHDLLGLAYAQTLQSVLIVIISWLMLRRLLPTLPCIPRRWNRERFIEMFKYGINFQLSSVFQMMFDPMTKVLLSKFGGLELVGYFEMANRMVLQFRSLLISANQVFVPFIASMHEVSPDHVPGMYRNSYQVLLYLAMPLFAGVALFIPVISELWIGHYQSSFVLFALMLTGGWFINTMSGPAYFSNLGIGRLKWNTISSVIIGLLNGVLGIMFGYIAGGAGVVAGFVTALIIGSMIIIYAYSTEHAISMKEVFPGSYAMIAGSSITAIVASWLMYHIMQHTLEIVFVGLIGISIYALSVVPFIWLHPMRTKLANWVNASSSKRAKTI